MRSHLFCAAFLALSTTRCSDVDLLKHTTESACDGGSSTTRVTLELLTPRATPSASGVVRIRGSAVHARGAAIHRILAAGVTAHQEETDNNFALWYADVPADVLQQSPEPDGGATGGERTVNVPVRVYDACSSRPALDQTFPLRLLAPDGGL